MRTREERMEEEGVGTGQTGMPPVEPWMDASSIQPKRSYVQEKWGDDPRVRHLCFYLIDLPRLTRADEKEVERCCFGGDKAPAGSMRVVKSARYPGWILRVDGPRKVVYDLELRGIHRPLAIAEFEETVVVRSIQRAGGRFEDRDNTADFTQLL